LSDGEYAAGVGLDLYFCRLIVATNGGRMWVDENPGGGSILRFTVPLYEPALSASV
jgi:signal transduction histidine kinase